MGVTVAAGFWGCLNTGCYYHQLLERVSFSRTLESLEQSDISVPRKLTQTRFNIFREAFISMFASRRILPNTYFTLWQDWKMKKTDVFFRWNHHHHVCKTPYSSRFCTLCLPRHQFKALLCFFFSRVGHRPGGVRMKWKDQNFCHVNNDERIGFVTLYTLTSGFTKMSHSEGPF